MELTKKCVITHKNGVIQIKEIDFTGKCIPGKGFNFAEFDTEEELKKYIMDNTLITQEEAVTLKKAYLNDIEVDINYHLFDDNIVLVDN